MMQHGKYTAVVLAAQREGRDPLAGDDHKCLIDLQGEPMIAWVLRALLTAPRIGKVLVSIEDPRLLNSIPVALEARRSGKLMVVASAANLYLSVDHALRESGSADYPAIITTADNPLLTPEMLAHFCSDLEARDLEVAVAMTRAGVMKSKYPDGQRRFYAFRDDDYSNCNLYAITSERAVSAARVFRNGGQFGKKAVRLLRAFGPLSFLLYKFRLFTLDGTGERLSRGFGFRFGFVDMPFAEAPIDVDNERTLKIAREILTARMEAQTLPAARTG